MCTLSPHDWKVTRSLVSYDHKWVKVVPKISLKGHQIIGELRLIICCQIAHCLIERSPDHWWVTTCSFAAEENPLRLKGHQIIGELRPSSMQKDTFQWLKGHQIIGELRPFKLSLQTLPTVLKGHQIIGELRPRKNLLSLARVRLKGHQIIGELRPGRYDLMLGAGYWKVTRSLVSYDRKSHVIELGAQLKGHQIIGELRHCCSNS